MEPSAPNGSKMPKRSMLFESIQEVNHADEFPLILTSGRLGDHHQVMPIDILAESGERFIHGNFLWSGYIAIFVLYAASLVVLLRQEKGRGMVLCWALFGLHVISGAVFAFTQTLGKQYVDWW